MRPGPVLAGIALVAACVVAPGLVRPAQAAYETMPPHVAETVQRHDGQLRRCFRRGLRAEPQLRGKLTVRFRVGSRGRAVDVRILATQSTLHHRGVERCVERVFRAMRFRRVDTPTWYRSPLIFASA